jgi:transposase
MHATASREHSTSEVNSIGSSEWTSLTSQASVWLTAQTILCEIGADVSRFRNASAFAFWPGLCPEKKIGGGKVLFTKSRRVRRGSRRLFACVPNHRIMPKTMLREFFRRITRKVGGSQAITATAHNLLTSCSTC